LIVTAFIIIPAFIIIICTIDILFCILSGHEGWKSLSFEAGIVRYVTCMTNRKQVPRHGRHTSINKANIHVTR